MSNPLEFILREHQGNSLTVPCISKQGTIIVNFLDKERAGNRPEDRLARRNAILEVTFIKSFR